VRTRIKFCGCTATADALAAVEAGADAVGVILAPESTRRVRLSFAREIAAASGITYRTAAYRVAIDRVVRSLKLRGVYA